MGGEASSLKAAAMQLFSDWKEAGKPCSGTVFEKKEFIHKKVAYLKI